MTLEDLSEILCKPEAEDEPRKEIKKFSGTSEYIFVLESDSFYVKRKYIHIIFEYKKQLISMFYLLNTNSNCVFILLLIRTIFD